MRRGACAPLVTAVLLGGCSSGGTAVPVAATDQVLTGSPAPGSTACSLLPRHAVEQLYGAKVTRTEDRRASRPRQTAQTGCVVDVAGEPRTALALYLWSGDGFKDQWTDEVNVAGTDGLTEQPYGVEAYGGVSAYQTTVAVRERHFAVRLLCGATPAAPEKPVGVGRCASLVAALAERLSG